MSLITRFTHNSLSTIIAWLSTCLLAGGASTLFNESSRTMWLIWGCFGLAAAVGLDITARVRERMQKERLKLIATRRLERDMEHEAEEKELNAAIREAVANMLGRTASAPQTAASCRPQDRFPCDLDVELLVDQVVQEAARNRGICGRVGRVTNLSEVGFELTLTEPLSRGRTKMVITTASGDRQTMLGEVLWCGPQPDGSIAAGGRFLKVVSVEGDRVNDTLRPLALCGNASEPDWAAQRD
jgi:hypothetical protein